MNAIHNRRRMRRGLTFIELLIALGISAVLLTATAVCVVFGTVTARPGEASCAAVPEAATAPLHVAFVYSVTVEPGGAMPVI